MYLIDRPLSEGKALKEKFDAIFASTRYVKALETIRKVKQMQDQELKLYKQEVTHLKQLKDKSEQVRCQECDEVRGQIVNVMKADKLEDLIVSNQMDAVIDRSSDIKCTLDLKIKFLEGFTIHRISSLIPMICVPIIKYVGIYNISLLKWSPIK